MGIVRKRLPQHLALQRESREASVCLYVFKPFSLAGQIRLIQRKYGRILTGFYKKGLEKTEGILLLSLLNQFNKSLSLAVNYCLIEGCVCFL